MINNLFNNICAKNVTVKYKCRENILSVRDTMSIRDITPAQRK